MLTMVKMMILQFENIDGMDVEQQTVDRRDMSASQPVDAEPIGVPPTRGLDPTMPLL